MTFRHEREFDGGVVKDGREYADDCGNVYWGDGQVIGVPSILVRFLDYEPVFPGPIQWDSDTSDRTALFIVARLFDRNVEFFADTSYWQDVDGVCVARKWST